MSTTPSAIAAVVSNPVNGSFRDVDDAVVLADAAAALDAELELKVALDDEPELEPDELVPDEPEPDEPVEPLPPFPPFPPRGSTYC